MGAIISTSGDWAVTPTTWPWPRIEFLSHYNIGITTNGDKLSLYELELNDSGSYVATHVADIADASDQVDISISDFGKFFMLAVRNDTDANSFYSKVHNWYRHPGVDASEEGAYTEGTLLRVPRHQTCCNYRGQALIGGIYAEHPDWTGLGKHSFAWSLIGGLDFRIVDNTTAGHGNLFEGMAGDCEIWKMMPLGSSVVIYTNRGVYQTAFVAGAHPGWANPVKLATKAPKFGQCIVGDEKVHYFIDENNNLWKITSESVQKLGYGNHLNALWSTRMILDSHEHRLYISNSDSCHVLHGDFLFQSGQYYTSLERFQEGLGGLFIDSANKHSKLVVHTQDFRSRGFKTVNMLELGYVSDQKVYGYVRWRNDSGAFLESEKKEITSNGIVVPMVSAVDFQIVIETEEGVEGNLSIDYLIVKIKYSDKRFRRGSYVPDQTAT